ncbi:MAG: anti-sigma factor [Chloroflexota bacterium]|nr:anti-sigma factor [Chloroflexota bacterium]
MSIHDEIQEMLPAFALDAIDDADRARVERHLPQCDVCARVAADYRPVTDLLAHAAPPVELPADLKYRVLAATMPKQTPTAAGFSITAALVGLFRAPAFAAVALVLVIALGIWNVSLQNQISQQAAFNQRMEAELTHQSDFMMTMAYANGQPKQLWGTQVASRAVGRLYGAPDETTLALIALDMPTLPAGKTYQVWLIDPSGNRTSGGTFRVDEQGRGWLLIRAPTPLGNYQGVGITQEPEGGSPAPTGDKMLGTSL